jgi:signal transduction histidine kinase
MVQLSGRFVGILSEQVDVAIEEIQCLIVESLGLDQSRLWQFAEGQPDLLLTHQWRRPELSPLPPQINSPECFPWMHEKILKGEAFYFASIDELPPDAARDLDTFRIHGPKSSIVIPVFSDGQVFGAIAFDAFASEKRWRIDEVAQLKMVAQMIGNVIARQQVDERVQQLRREIAHSGRAAILGELAAALAHELNQPLTAILSNAQAARRFIRNGTVDLNEFRVILDDVVRDDKRAGAVIHNLRAMLNKEPVAREPCRLNDLVSDTADLLRGEMLAQKVELRLALAPDLPTIDAGRVEIQQVIVNLILNAVQAMKKTPPAHRAVTIETRREGSGVSVSIRDRGPGIPPERLLTIFSPFYTTKTTGLGMGLAICRRLIEAHAGRIEAHNRDEGGAVVSFFLPFIGNRRRAPKPSPARPAKDNKDVASDPAEKRTPGVSQRRGAIDR